MKSGGITYWVGTMGRTEGEFSFHDGANHELGVV